MSCRATRCLRPVTHEEKFSFTCTCGTAQLHKGCLQNEMAMHLERCNAIGCSCVNGNYVTACCGAVFQPSAAMASRVSFDFLFINWTNVRRNMRAACTNNGHFLTLGAVALLLELQMVAWVLDHVVSPPQVWLRVLVAFANLASLVVGYANPKIMTPVITYRLMSAGVVVVTCFPMFALPSFVSRFTVATMLVHFVAGLLDLRHPLERWLLSTTQWNPVASPAAHSSS